MTMTSHSNFVEKARIPSSFCNQLARDRVGWILINEISQLSFQMKPMISLLMGI
ncbi:hypothetical protein V6Z11_A08G203600 [Gossypium hirsutum]